MSEQQGGGAAFPHSYEESGHPRWRESPGMTLRDYFAAAILPAVYTHAMVVGCESQDTICAEAYELADTMLEARERDAQ